MTLDWSKLLPVLVSIAIIISVALLRQYSRTLAAIAAVMPINIPLGMWIVYAGGENKQVELAQFTDSLLVNILPTLLFIVVVWQTTRHGMGLLPSIVLGYIVWAVGMGLIFLLRAWLGG